MIHTDQRLFCLVMPSESLNYHHGGHASAMNPVQASTSDKNGRPSVMILRSLSANLCIWAGFFPNRVMSVDVFQNS